MLSLPGFGEVTWRVTDHVDQIKLDRVVACCPSVTLAINYVVSHPDKLIPRSVKPYVHEEPNASFVKPRHHARAHYINVGECWIAVKGAEVLVDSNAISNRVENASQSTLHWFTMVENIAPFAHVHAECMDECVKACAAQLAHLDKFGTLAPIPFPLFVLKISDTHWQAYKECMRKRLLPNRYLYEKFIQNISAEDGLGIYVYHMQCAPYPRVLHETTNPPRPIVGESEFETFINGLVGNVFNLLRCGYFCVSLAGGQKGNALQPQNVIFPTGAFVDVDSLTHIDDVDPALFQDLVRITFESLTYTLFCVLHGVTLTNSHLPNFHERVNAFTQAQQLQLPLVLLVYRKLWALHHKSPSGTMLHPQVAHVLFDDDSSLLLTTRDVWKF